MARRNKPYQIQVSPTTMKNHPKKLLLRYLSPVVFCVGFMGSLGAADMVKRVEVSFDQPEKFRDVRDSGMDTEKGREHILTEFREFIEEQCQKLVGADQKLAITFTEIDLAGDFEPWRGAQWSEIRVVKDIYPPRMDFTYRLTDANGVVIKEGKAQLRDQAFASRLTIDRNDPLRIEKDMLRDWLRSEIPSAK